MTSLFSPQWFRVAERRPQLRAHVQLLRQTQRGTTWYLLQDALAEPGAQMHRVNRAGYEFIGRCDGRRSVQQIWDELLAALPEDAPTQDELLQLLVALHGENLLQFDVAPDVETMFRHHDKAARKRRRQGVNPWAFRLVLFDPQPLLAALAPLAPWLFNGVAFALWLAAMATGALLALGHAAELQASAATALASPGHWLLAWLLYPPIKLVHELAHGLAVTRWGAQVRRAGLTLLMLTPVPFVDASAADTFRQRRRRAVVSAAGIMAELALAAFALGVWLLVEPGRLRDAALAVMLIGAASTLLVNGNPLMRFDGYYLLCDLLDLRNLAARSNRWWSAWFIRRVLGSEPPGVPLEPMPGERGWLIAYAPLAWLWRSVLSLTLALWLGSISLVLGAIALATTGFVLIVRPLWKLAATLRQLAEAEGQARRRWRLAGRALLAVSGLAALLLVPLPFATLAEGVVWLPEQAQVRTPSAGFVARIVAADGQRVQAGDLLVELHNEAYAAERTAQAGRAAELEVALYDAMASDPQRAPALRERLGASQAEIARLDQRIAQLEVRAQVSGRLVMPQAEQLAGTWCREGTLLAQVLTDDAMTVRVALPQQDAALVQAAPPAVRVSLAEYAARVWPGRLTQDTPAAVSKLPSAALGDRGGGRILTDGSDSDGLKTRGSVVLLDVRVAGARSERVGARALVRFDHGYAPLAARALRGLQQLVLQHFNPER